MPELPTRKTGVRRQRNKVSVDGGSVPRVQPAQDPGLNATEGAFGKQQAEDLVRTGEDISEFAEDRSDRLFKARERIRAKEVLNTRLELDNKFVTEARELQQKHVTEDTISGKSFPEEYGAELNELQIKTLEEARLSGNFSQEDLLEFENDLIKSHNTESNAAVVKHQEAFSAKQGKLVDKSVMAVRESPEFKNATTHTKRMAMIDEQVRRFNPVLSEHQQEAIANKHIREESIPQFNALLNGGELEEAELFLNKRRVKEAFGEDAFRGLSEKVNTRQAVVLKAFQEAEAKDNLFRQRHNIPPGTALTPEQRAVSQRGEITAKQQGLDARATLDARLGRPATDAERVKEAGAAPQGPMVTFTEMSSFKKEFGKGEAKVALEMRADGLKAEEDLVQLKLLRAAFESGNFRTGPVADLRQFASQLAIFVGAPPEVLDLIGDAKTADVIQASISKLLVEEAGNLSRVTNLSIGLVKDSFAKLSRTLEGNIVLVKVFERVAERRIELARMAAQMASRDSTLFPANKPSFDDERAALEKRDPVIPESLITEIKTVSDASPVVKDAVKGAAKKGKEAAGSALDRLKQAFGGDKEVVTEVPEGVTVPDGVEFMGTDGDQAILKLKNGDIVKGPLANLKKKGKK